MIATVTELLEMIKFKCPLCWHPESKMQLNSQDNIYRCNKCGHKIELDAEARAQGDG